MRRRAEVSFSDADHDCFRCMNDLSCIDHLVAHNIDRNLCAYNTNTNRFYYPATGNSFTRFFTSGKTFDQLLQASSIEFRNCYGQPTTQEATLGIGTGSTSPAESAGDALD